MNKYDRLALIGFLCFFLSILSIKTLRADTNIESSNQNTWTISTPILVDSSNFDQDIDSALEFGKSLLRKRCQKSEAFAVESAWSYEETSANNYITLYGLCSISKMIQESYYFDKQYQEPTYY